MKADATKKIFGEAFKRAWPPFIKMDDNVKAKAERFFWWKRINSRRWPQTIPIPRNYARHWPIPTGLRPQPKVGVQHLTWVHVPK